MSRNLSHLLCWLFMVVVIHLDASKSECVNALCKKKTLTLNTDTSNNFSLEGFVFETLNLSVWKDCLYMCMRKCQCLSFNFHEKRKTGNCELNDASTMLEPDALKAKEGLVYYEPVRTHYDNKGIPSQSRSNQTCHNKCCDMSPCQHGGTCHGVCDVTRRRYRCTCAQGFSGYKCQIRLPRSCKDVMVLENATSTGIYNIVDEDNKPFPVYCDVGSESRAAWTLIQSCSLPNFLDHFQRGPFYAYNMPINPNSPGWQRYRLSLPLMQSIRNASTHWRATCNFPTDGVDYRDYWRVSLQNLDLTVDNKKGDHCLFSEHVNVRGNECTNCTVWCMYSSTLDLHMDSWGGTGGCSFNGRPGGIRYEDNFGYYTSRNHNFRCTSSINSTTQFWLGSF